MIQRLRTDYRQHLWYEHVSADGNDDGADENTRRWKLQESKRYGRFNMADKKLSYESDRPKVTFLDRQCYLLGRYTGGNSDHGVDQGEV